MKIAVNRKKIVLCINLFYFSIVTSALGYYHPISPGDTLARMSSRTIISDMAVEGDSVLWSVLTAYYPIYGESSLIHVPVKWNLADSSYIIFKDNSVMFLDLDTKGRLWCASPISGFSIFDGSDWTTIRYDFSLIKYDSAFINGVRGISIDPQNNVWISSLYTEGLVRFDGGNWAIPDIDWGKFPEATPIVKNPIKSFGVFLADREGNIWWIDHESLLRKYDGDSVRVYDLDCPYGFRSIDMSPDNHLFLGSVGLVYEINGEEVKELQVDPLTVGGDNYDDVIKKIIAISSENLWVATEGKGIFHYDGEIWKNYFIFDGVTNHEIMAGAVEPNGRTWLASYDGLNMVGWRTFFEYHAYPKELWNRNITAMAVDSSLAKWLATDDGDIWIFSRDSVWSACQDAAFLKGKKISSMAIDSSNLVWIGTLDNGIFSFNKNGWAQFTFSDGLASDQVTCLRFDPQGRLWCGTNGSGICIFNGESWTIYNSSDGLASDSVTAIAFDAWGDTWIGTKNGLSQFNGSGWTNFTTADGLPDNEITALFADQHTYINLGTKEGLTMYDGVNWINHEIEGSEEGNRVTVILRQGFETGKVWVGTLQGFYEAPYFPIHPVPVESEESGLKRNKLPKSFSLSQNFPNPFNPSTSINFNVPDGIKPHNITLKIYDLRGRLKRTLIDKHFAPGSHTVIWNGEDDRGQKVSSGVYFYRLISAGFSQTRKMVLMK